MLLKAHMLIKEKIGSKLPEHDFQNCREEQLLQFDLCHQSAQGPRFNHNVAEWVHFFYLPGIK